MNGRQMNFIRATARGILQAMDDLKADERAAMLRALTDMTAPREKLTAQEVAYYAVMYLASHDWEMRK